MRRWTTIRARMARGIGMALLATTTAGLAFAQDTDEPPEGHDLGALLADAVKHHEAGDLEGAALRYEKIVAAVPEAARVRSNLGAVYARLGRYDDALAQYRAALAVEDDPAIRFNLAMALQKSGRIAEASDEAAKLVAQFPDRREAVLLLASCHVHEGKLDEAVALLKPQAGRHPDDKAIAHLLGTALLELGRTDEAAVVLDPIFRDGTPESHVLLATMHEKRGEWAKARAELELARQGNPNLPLINFLYGTSLMYEQSNWAGAIEAFRKELEINPTHFEANLMLGNLLRQEGQHDEALPFLERAAQLRGTDLAVKFALGATYLALERLDEAQPLLEEVGRNVPDHLPTHMQLAILYSRQGRTEDAQRERQTVARLQQASEATRFDAARESINSLLGKQTE